MTVASVLPTTLPEEFKKYFWDIDATQLNPGENPGYVINRILNKGNLQASRWLLQNFPKSLIVDTLKTWRDFSPWNAVFWANFFGIPREEVRCLNKSYLAMRKSHWPY